MNYNWDDLEVDDSVNHNSRYFFANRRSKHERNIETEDPVDEIFNQQIGNLVLKEPETRIKTEPAQSLNNQIVSSEEPGANLNDATLSLETNKNPFQIQLDNPISSIKEENKNADENVVSSNNKENELQSNELNQLEIQRNPVCNLVTPSRFVKPTNGAIPKAINKNIATFERLTKKPTKREELLRKQIEEERKMRQFHSRAMPIFKTPDRPRAHKVTIPKTPDVAKRSKETHQKRLEKLKELEQKYKPLPFKAQEAEVLKEQPFVPKYVPTVLEVKPYNLRSERRLQERKKYDQAVQRAINDERQKQEEERKKLEDERFKELRKATLFKARPNPFK